jgi:hypothetical protein
MAFQFGTTARNAALDQIFTTIGTTPTLKIWSGTIPANCAAADSAGTTLATITCPNPYMASASGGVKALTGTWQDAAADASGTASHFRMYQGATCHIQGTITATGGGGDMTLDNITIASGQQINITSFSITAGGA